MKKLTEFPAVEKYLNRIGAEQRSQLKAVVKEAQGQYWRDVAIIKFTKKGEIEAPTGYQPTEEEKERIRFEVSDFKWPECVFIPKGVELHEEIKQAAPEDVFEFKNINGDTIMYQVRMERKGQRSYIPFTYYDNGTWEKLEPEGDLPLYGLHRLKDNTTIFIHEGAKAARFSQEIADGKHPNHPWSSEFANAAHLGFIGGALSPHRTDWSVLRKHGVTRAYIIADNDAPGLSAVPKIAKELNCITYLVQFSDQFATSFDMADPFPKSFFKTIQGKDYYIGPTFRQCLSPATWLTNLVPVGEGDKVKYVAALRQHVKSLWTFVEESNMFVHSELSELIRTPEMLDKTSYAFCDTKKVSELFLAAFTGRTARLAYRPDMNKRKLIVDGEQVLNLYVPPSIKPQEGDCKPFLDFMEYLIPNVKERHEVLRWCATIIAKPDIRILYGMLLISQQTGTGKTTLGERILAPLVGLHNTSFPSEMTIMEQFNGWIAKKRLAVIGEIYQGHSWKAATKLKQYITDSKISLREMYQPPVTLDNFAHFFVCSNSLAALKLDENDRRWLVPEVTEVRWTDDKFQNFFDWLSSGGLAIIADWANKFGDYVKAGQKAPQTQRKLDIITNSQSRSIEKVVDLAEFMSSVEEPFIVCDSDIMDWLSTFEKVYDTKDEIKKTMARYGVLQIGKDRVSFGNRLQYGLANKAAREKLRDLTIKEGRGYIKKPQEILNSAI